MTVTSKNADQVNLQELCSLLSRAACDLDARATWPQQQFAWCAEYGVFRWFIPRELGGWNWSDREILEGYLSLSQHCLTTSFVLTQWNAACRRIAASPNQSLSEPLLRRMADGNLFATVGISHLSTSRQHVGRPVMSAELQSDGSYLLNGYSAWVTAAAHADILVVGATVADGEQILCAVPQTRDGVKSFPGQQLVALTCSCTDRIELNNVRVAADEILAGPVANVMQSGGGGTGGLQTSTLAIGLSLAATNYLHTQAQQRSDLREAAERLSADADQLKETLFALAEARSTRLSASELRGRANSLALRSTQAALAAAKGAGFAAHHPVGRWAREALFFLVWSCPQPVLASNLQELSQSPWDECPNL
jgi:alkylation response protein AidB-like acyl-CoA dehydrogenase